MHTVVIASSNPLYVGRRHRGLVTDMNREWVEMTLLVVKQSTEEAYKKQLVELGQVMNPWECRVWYYEVLTD